jgi:hypothetical protein
VFHSKDVENRQKNAKGIRFCNCVYGKGYGFKVQKSLKSSKAIGVVNLAAALNQHRAKAELSAQTAITPKITQPY